MVTVVIVLSLVFASLGLVVTAGNAKYILSGYNTMSEADRAKMDIDGYLKFFKRFHIWLGVTLLAGYFALGLVSNNWAGAFIVLYPLLGYVFLLAKSNRFYKGTKGQRSGTYVGMAILLVVAIAVGIQLNSSFKNADIALEGEALEIKGLYGIKVPRLDISAVEMVPELPPISFKTNGFAAGDFSKGSFKTKDGRHIKLFVNKKAKPFLLIKTKKEEIYYSSDEASSPELREKIKAWMSR